MATVGVKGLTTNVSVYFTIISEQKVYFENYRAYYRHVANHLVRRTIKKFSAWPSYVQNKIKIVFASYSSKARNTTCTIWLLGYKYFVHVSGRRLSAVEVEKSGVTQCNEMTILTDSFVPLHALLFWLRIEVLHSRFILNNELWNKFLLAHVLIFREVLQKVVRSSGVSISTPIWQTLCSYAEMY